MRHPNLNRFGGRQGMWLLNALLMVALLGLTGTSQAPLREAGAAASTTLSYEPSDKERRISKLVSAVVERSHYRQSPINDPVSSVTLDRYLETLDPGHSYFLASDIKDFERIRYQLDDAVLNGTLEPIFAIYNRYQTRTRERLSYAMTLLKTEPNFTLEERFQYDRSKAPWPATQEEMNELWRLRVKNDAVVEMLAGKKWPETRDLLSKRYDRALKRLEQIKSDDVFEIFMNAFVHVFDPHSNYFSPSNSDEYKIQMSLSYEGIGASLQLVDDYVVVQNIIPGGSAAASGTLNTNDRIVAVGEGKEGKLVDVVGWRLDEVVQLIRGKEGSTVRLQIMPSGAAPGSENKVISLVRSKISLETQAAKKEMRTITRNGQPFKVGVITVPGFYQDFEARARGDVEFRSTTRDVRKLIDELKTEGVQAIVIDLRGNGGGHLTEATGLTGLFINKGPVVQLRETGGQSEVLDDPEPNTAWDGPLSVLVDRFSASASEIFAGAIQDYGRGVVIGQQTYGKGTVQNLYPLDRYAVDKTPGFGQLTITIGKFYRVTGESTQHRGVLPDVVLPSAISLEEVGESAQESALPWDRIRSANFVRTGNIKPALEGLVKSHTERVVSDPNYQAYLQSVAAFEEIRKEKTVSLNLEQRRQERDRQDQARLDRENARRAALKLKPVANLEALNSKEVTKEAPDALLDETVQVTADFDLWLQKSGTLNAATTSPRSP